MLRIVFSIGFLLFLVVAKGQEIKIDSSFVPEFELNIEYEIFTNDGGAVIGKVVAETHRDVIFENYERKKTFIPKYAIRSKAIIPDAPISEEVEEIKDAKSYGIRLFSGAVYLGKIVAQTKREVTIKTHEGKIFFIPKHEIKEVTLLTDENYVDGDFYDENKHEGNYMILSSAFPFKRKKGKMRFNNFLNVNLNVYESENFSIGVNSTLIASPLMLNVKAHFRLTDNNYLGVEAMYGTPGLFNIYSHGGFAVLKYTHGDKLKNFTLSGGYGKYNEKVADRRGRLGATRTYDIYFGNLAGMTRFNNKLAFVGELWYFQLPLRSKIPNTGTSVVNNALSFGVLGLGMKTVKNPNMSWTYGFYVMKIFYSGTYTGVRGRNTFIPIPYIGLATNF